MALSVPPLGQVYWLRVPPFGSLFRVFFVVFGRAFLGAFWGASGIIWGPQNDPKIVKKDVQNDAFSEMLFRSHFLMNFSDFLDL